MNESWSIHELAETVNAWCTQHRVVPANGQASERISERNLRFYRTVGLVDAPASGAGRGYGEKHRLQAIAIRLLQAQGLPLRRIRELLLGRSLADLREIERRGLAATRGATRAMPPFHPSAAPETWTLTPLTDEFLLVSRRPHPVPPDLLDALRAVLVARGVPSPMP